MRRKHTLRHRLRKKLFSNQKYINKKIGPLRVVYAQGSGLYKGIVRPAFYGADLTVYLGDYMFVLLLPEVHKSYIHKF